MSLGRGITGEAAIRLGDQGFRMSLEAAAPAALSDSAQNVEWVAAARAGDRGAFGRLYERYFHMVHGILLARVPPADVRDLIQDVFLLALRKLPSLRDSAAFGGWLAQIARNRANDYYRHPRQPAEVQNEEDAEVTTGAAAPQQEKTEALAALRAIRELPEAYRETRILRFVEGMTGPEIAARTGLTAGSVRVNLHRGVKMLRERLAHGVKP